MPRFFLNQKGVFPIILIIILTVVIAGVAGVVYQSRKEIKVRSDKSTEVTELTGTPEPTPKSAEVELANSGKLADKPFELKVDDSITSSPKFSITPPAGWEKKSAEGNVVVDFLSSSEDKVAENTAWLSVQPSISVNVVKSQYKNLDEAMEANLRKRINSGNEVNSKQKVKVNGEAAYVLESVMDIREAAQKILESQIQEELAKVPMADKDAARKEAQKDMGKVLEKAKIRILSYVFYKDGYFITVAGKAFESFWSKRGPQIKRSMDTFKLE